jgi:hypothetical protein
LVIRNTTNGRLLWFGFSGDATYVYVQIGKYNSLTSVNSTPYSKVISVTGAVMYFKVKKIHDGTQYIIRPEFSNDGVIWIAPWSEHAQDFLESSGTLNRIGIGVFASSVNTLAQAAFWWFRYNWIADFDPTTDN